MDAPYRKRSDIKTLVKLHNNDAGRLVSYFYIYSSFIFLIFYICMRFYLIDFIVIFSSYTW